MEKRADSRSTMAVCSDANRFEARQTDDNVRKIRFVTHLADPDPSF